MAATIDDAAEAFSVRGTCISGNVRSTGYEFVSRHTVVCAWVFSHCGSRLVVLENSNKFSVTTSQHQNAAARAAGRYGGALPLDDYGWRPYRTGDDPCAFGDKPYIEMRRYLGLVVCPRGVYVWLTQAAVDAMAGRRCEPEETIHELVFPDVGRFIPVKDAAEFAQLHDQLHSDMTPREAMHLVYPFTVEALAAIRTDQLMFTPTFIVAIGGSTDPELYKKLRTSKANRRDDTLQVRGCVRLAGVPNFNLPNLGKDVWYSVHSRT